MATTTTTTTSPTSAMPAGAIEPMYASVGSAIPEGPDWTFEPKYDGIRVVAEAGARRVRLLTRNGKDKAAQFPEVVAALRALAARHGRPLVVDGEIVAMAKAGTPARFQELQARMHVKDAATVASHAESTPAALLAFDMLRDGRTLLLERPWHERRSLLESTLAPFLASRDALPGLLLGESERGIGAKLLATAHRRGWEGIIAKRVDGTYRPGDRARDWLKLKIEFRQEFVIGGFTEPRNSREHLGALLLGYFDGAGDFVYVGHTGGGFTREGLRAMRAKLDRLERASSPFVTPPRTNEPAHWVTPRVVVEVKFNEWTADGRLRQPIYLGIRDDKEARDVGKEAQSVQRDSTSTDTTTMAAAARKTRRTSSKSTGPARRGAVGGIGRTRKSGGNGGARPPEVVKQLADIERDGGDGIVQFEDGATLAVTSLDKVYWPADGYTKGDLMRYYARVAPVLLPALADRPLALKRYPEGIEGHSFFQQNAGDHVPDAIRTTRVAVEDEGPQPRFVGGDLATLLYTVQLGTIAVNAWHSRVGALEWPDYAVLDLDPGPKVPFARIVEVARLVHRELDALGLGAALKTSGSRGLHIIVPLPRRTTYEASATLAEAVAERVVAAAPKIATVERSLDARDPGAIYVDHMQNAQGKTLASVLSARPRAGATVSMPLSWRALTSRLTPATYTIASAPGRLRRAAPLWEDVLAEGNETSTVRAAIRGAKLQGATSGSGRGGARRG